MRERVNVPFTFAFLEAHNEGRPVRVEKAAVVLEEAARHLVDWQDPPVDSASGREVFFEYARHLEIGAERFVDAVRSHDLDMATSRLDGIRQTCNGCHRFFRPTATTDDVGFDLGNLPGGDSTW